MTCKEKKRKYKKWKKTLCNQSYMYMGYDMLKRVFGHMRTAKAQISLRIRAVWSGPSLSAYRIIGYY